MSACLGYLFGQRALSGVSSPVTEAGNASSSRGVRDPRTVPLLNEAEVIATAEASLGGGPGARRGGGGAGGGRGVRGGGAGGGGGG
ncbi:hypothetical protein NW863_11690, partial [Synechococcus sp. B60.1]|uniref:hypothetical protein n=1 Tax=Synechococcus sp. B60.1 TaxID=2964522 RepID=UPI0039C3D51B